MSALSIVKHIYNLLANKEELTAQVGKNIYPLVAEESATFPFVIIKRNSVSPIYHKMGNAQDVATFSIGIVTTSYIQSVELAEIVRNILENYKIAPIQYIRLQDVAENYIDDAYVQELNFECYMS